MWSTSPPRGWKGLDCVSSLSARLRPSPRSMEMEHRGASSTDGDCVFSAFSGLDASESVADFSLPLPSAVSLPGRDFVAVSGLGGAVVCTRGTSPSADGARRAKGAPPPTRGASDGASGGGARRVARRKPPPPPEATAEFCFVRSDGRERAGPVARTLHPGLARGAMAGTLAISPEGLANGSRRRGVLSYWRTGWVR